MFCGFNRETRNSYRLQGIRIRYSATGVEMLAEQAGAHVAPNLDFTISARGPSGLVRTGGAFRAAALQTSAGSIVSTTNTLSVTTTDGAMVDLDFRMAFYRNITVSKTAAVISGDGNFAAAGRAPLTVSGGNANTSQDGQTGLTLLGGNASPNATTNIVGGHVMIVGGGGSSGSSAAAHGGDVRIGGGQGFGTGARGEVRLGWDGTNESRVRFRNTKLAIRGYSESTGAPTTTELPADGDCGIHKNTSSGTVFLAFNDGGTIRSVALT